MKLRFGRKVFRPIFIQELWTKFITKTAKKYNRDSFMHRMTLRKSSKIKNLDFPFDPFVFLQ
jgi:hypothetical protein